MSDSGQKSYGLMLDKKIILHKDLHIRGIKKEGFLRDCILYNGDYVSLIVMSILEDEYVFS